MSSETTRKKVAKSFKDIWSLAQEEHNTQQSEKKTERDSHVFFVGSKNAGKTTMLLQFLEREETAKPTTAMEYTFGRRSHGANIGKDITHLWELGGGTFLAKLVAVPITVDTVSSVAVVITVDLSRPAELWGTVEVFLKQIRQRVDTVLSELRKTQPAIIESLRQRAWKRFGQDHPDQELLSPMMIPVAIVGTKYDIFQEFDPEKKKMICKTLRFLAHMNGASLHYYSVKSESLTNITKQLISHLAFKTPINHSVSMDHNKPIIVAAGSDALGQIGVPSLPPGELDQISAQNPFELWKQSYGKFFPQVTGPVTATTNPSMEPAYSEHAVDDMRKHKDEELDKYRRLCERKFKSQQPSTGSGLPQPYQ